MQWACLYICCLAGAPFHGTSLPVKKGEREEKVPHGARSPSSVRQGRTGAVPVHTLMVARSLWFGFDV